MCVPSLLGERKNKGVKLTRLICQSQISVRDELFEVTVQKELGCDIVDMTLDGATGGWFEICVE